MTGIGDACRSDDTGIDIDVSSSVDAASYPAWAALVRGRPRDPARDDTIAAAVLEKLVDVGYEAMTVDAVAALAGVGRATVYRRWPSKANMVIGAISRRSVASIGILAMGVFRSDLDPQVVPAALPADLGLIWRASWPRFR